jgi:ABC-type nitrate/sulfonate/bicarbonate transport system ATPase subunit
MPAKLEVRNVRKSFATQKGPLPVIEHIDFRVDDGEFVAIVGPSGCGKTTLLNVIAGFERPDQGEIAVEGAPMHGPSPRGIVISQQGSVFPWLTVQQNLRFALNGHARDNTLADHYIELVGLKGFNRSYPHELSGGMLKRVEIARALAVKPEILYMDEPLAALDALTRYRMRIELLRILSDEHRTSLLVTHDVEEAIHMADRILVLSARPTRIQASFDVRIAQPRRLSSPEVLALKERILGELGL